MASEDGLGLALKETPQGPRYAIRHPTHAAYETAMHKRGMAEQLKWGKFLITGLRPQVGSFGVMRMLSPHGWVLEEV
eukprot:3166280-Amphidinium_carterae.1